MNNPALWVAAMRPGGVILNNHAKIFQKAFNKNYNFVPKIHRKFCGKFWYY